MRTSTAFLAATLTTLVLLSFFPRSTAVAADSLSNGFPCPSNAALTCVMQGLDGVRGLAFAPDGALYVAEAGHGGDGPCISQSGVQVCYGPSGAISRLSAGVQQRVLEHLPSLAINDPSRPKAKGQAANGPTDIGFAVDDEEDGDVPGTWSTYITIGLQNDPRLRDLLGAAGPSFARLLRVAPDGTIGFVGDPGTYEIENNPDDGPIESNPFGLLVEPGRRLIADASANALIRVVGNSHPHISTVATFPSRPQGRPTDSVPTSVSAGPDHAYYVSELTGIPFATWNAAIYKVAPGKEPEVFLDGFRMITDFAFDADWNVYVLQYGTVPGTTFGQSGVLTRVAVDGTRTTVLSGLRTPTSVAVGPDGSVYVSNVGNPPSNGEVVRVAPPQ